MVVQAARVKNLLRTEFLPIVMCSVVNLKVIPVKMQNYPMLPVLCINILKNKRKKKKTLIDTKKNTFSFVRVVKKKMQ